MKNLYIGTSWKMNKTRKETEQYFQVLCELLKGFDGPTIFTAIPFPYIWTAREMTDESSILIGGQNMHWEENGPFTGEVSVQMLVDMGVNFVELGHSERRSYYNETDFTVNKKVLSALEHNIIPLICIGENQAENEYGVGDLTIARQLKIALHGIEANTDKTFWIAYEPVWAIGEKGTPATPDYVGKMHTVIRETLTAKFVPEVAERVPVLYGGSVNLNNCKAFIQAPNVDGIFIGRAAWDAHSFFEIIKLVSQNGF
jgi:L-erythrulose 1-phosphate isomerase